MLNETTGAFDGVRTHDRQVSIDHESDALPTVPRRLQIETLQHFRETKQCLRENLQYLRKTTQCRRETLPLRDTINITGTQQ